MIQMTLAQLTNVLSLSPATSDQSWQGLSIDTRTLQPGNLFIALPGEQVDGHHYLEEAQKKGAIGALVTRQMPSSLSQWVVPDTVNALGQLGAYWRNQFNLPIVAVTGSNGKTTTKNMLAAIMTAACNGNTAEVLATQGTLNNHLGLPLTLCQLNATHRYAAIEMGMNHFGELKYLTHLTRPDVAIITNAAAAHLEGLGSVFGVAQAKGEIFLGLSDTGTAILNRDDAHFTYWQGLIGKRSFFTFGFHKEAHVRAQLHDGSHFTLITPQGNIDIQLPLIGQHNILNALAAAAAALAINIELTAIKTGLEQCQPAKGRLQLHTLTNGVRIIDDTYNANPFSLQAAVNTLSSFQGKKILVLGDMKELGTDAASLHHAAGEDIRKAGIHYLFTYGELSAQTTRAFGDHAQHFTEQENLVNAVKPFLHNQTTVLVKGSRSMRMEKVIAGLISN